jgi:hypothetical protein
VQYNKNIVNSSFVFNILLLFNFKKMKKIYGFLLPLLVVGGFWGCQKPTTEAINPDTTSQWEKRMKSNNGVLAFSSWDDLDQAKLEIDAKSFADLSKFGEKYGFTSQRYIFEKIVRLEEEKLIALEKQYPNVHSYEEAKALGIKKPEHTPDFFNAMNKGVIKVTEDTENATTYFFSVIDPTLVSVLNEDGFVVVGDELCLYTETSMKFIKGGLDKMEMLKRATKSDPSQNLIVYNHKLERTTNWDLNGNNNTGNWVTPIEGNSNRRAKYERRGFSNVGGNGTCDGQLFGKFFANVFAQRSYLGIWAFSGSFTPTFTFNSTWSYFFERGCDGVNCFPDCSYSNLSVGFGVTTSPMVNRTYFGNNSVEAFPMHPHASGYWYNLPFTVESHLNFGNTWDVKIGSTDLD